MSITSRITKQWVVPTILLIVGIVVAIGFIYPMFSRSREVPVASRVYDASPMPESSMTQLAKPSALEAPAARQVRGRAMTASSGVAWAASVNRMVIYTAEVSLETKEIEKQHREIARVARTAGGYLTSSGVQNSDGNRHAQITVRVPQDHYASTLDSICKLGKVLARDEKGEDVTEEYVDLQSRLRNLKREEQAFLTVLGRASRIPDILAVENELSRVRGEIEQAEGREKFLKNQTDLATITVSISEPPQPIVAAAASWSIVTTARGAFNSLSVVFRGITSFVIWALVFIPLWAVLGVVAYGVRRRFRRVG